MRQGLSLVFLMMLGISVCQADGSPRCGPLPPHTAATAVREIANLFYAPFADYPFTADGICVDPGLFQVMLNVYFRTADNTAPLLQSLCLSSSSPGELSLRWS